VLQVAASASARTQRPNCRRRSRGSPRCPRDSNRCRGRRRHLAHSRPPSRVTSTTTSSPTATPTSASRMRLPSASSAPALRLRPARADVVADEMRPNSPTTRMRRRPAAPRRSTRRLFVAQPRPRAACRGSSKARPLAGRDRHAAVRDAHPVQLVRDLGARHVKPPGPLCAASAVKRSRLRSDRDRACDASLPRCPAASGRLARSAPHGRPLPSARILPFEPLPTPCLRQARGRRNGRLFEHWRLHGAPSRLRLDEKPRPQHPAMIAKAGSDRRAESDAARRVGAGGPAAPQRVRRRADRNVSEIFLAYALRFSLRRNAGFSMAVTLGPGNPRDYPQPARPIRSATESTRLEGEQHRFRWAPSQMRAAVGRPRREGLGPPPS